MKLKTLFLPSTNSSLLHPRKLVQVRRDEQGVEAAAGAHGKEPALVLPKKQERLEAELVAQERSGLVGRVRAPQAASRNSGECFTPPTPTTSVTLFWRRARVLQSVEEPIDVPTVSAPAKIIPCCLSDLLIGHSQSKPSQDEQRRFLQRLEPSLPPGIQDEILMVLLPRVRTARKSCACACVPGARLPRRPRAHTRTPTSHTRMLSVEPLLRTANLGHRQLWVDDDKRRAPHLFRPRCTGNSFRGAQSEG